MVNAARVRMLASLETIRLGARTLVRLAVWPGVFTASEAAQRSRQHAL